MRISVSILTLLALTAPGFAAEAITYRGTIDDVAVVVELTDLADGPVVGRYSRMEEGIDIPLQAAQGDYGALLSEEASCMPDFCPVNAEYDVTTWPLAANWMLEIRANGAVFGTWKAPGESPKPPIMLKKVGLRTLPAEWNNTPQGLSDSASEWVYTPGAEFSAATAPYDFAKMDVPPKEGAIESLDGSHFRYVSDPRTTFPFPRIVDLADGSDVTAINGALAAAHAVNNIAVFECASHRYAGFGGGNGRFDMGFGEMGAYDEENIELTYLSPTLTSWTQTGSTMCGGAHPNNHDIVTALDTRTGKPLALARVFKDWSAVSNINDYSAPVDQAEALAAPGDYTWQAGQDLIDYVIANRTPDDSEGDEDSSCETDALIASNLGVRFRPGDVAVFDLEDLPHAVFACGRDLLTVKLADIPDLLAPTAKDYFPSLAAK